MKKKETARFQLTSLKLHISWQELFSWAVKENFQDLVKLINQEIGDDEIQKHLNESGKNATCLSHFSAEEYLEIIIDLIEKLIYLQAVIFHRYQMKALNWLFLPDSLRVALIRHLRNLYV